MTLRLTRLHRLCALVVVSVLVFNIVGCAGGGLGSGGARTAAPAPACSLAQAGLLGDLNANGLPDVSDAIGILRIVVGLAAGDPLADCDADGFAGVSDAIMVLRCVVGLEEWPISVTVTDTTDDSGVAHFPLGDAQKTVTVALADNTPVPGTTVQATPISQTRTALLVFAPGGEYYPSFGLVDAVATSARMGPASGPVQSESVVVVGSLLLFGLFSWAIHGYLTEVGNTAMGIFDLDQTMTVNADGSVDATVTPSDGQQPASAPTDLTAEEADALKGSMIARDVPADDIATVLSERGFSPRVIVLRPGDKWPSVVDLYTTKAPDTILAVPVSDFFILSEDMLTIETPQGQQSGAVRIYYEIDTPQGTLHSFVVTWGHQAIGQAHTPTITEVSGGILSGSNTISDIPPGRHSFVWDSGADMPGEANSTVQVTMSYVHPVQHNLPWARQTDFFTVDNSGGGGGDPGDETIGPDGQTLLWVPGGSFMMGSEDGWYTEGPVHQVTLDGFWIGQCEVTNAQYRAFCDATSRAFPADSDQADAHPVLCITWHDAQAYCDHYGYALPTEAQWEYAARGPDARAYPWGDEWDEQKCCSGYNTGPGGRTFPVGSFPAGASWCGALDMAGNVWEWCANWYYDYEFSPVLNPPGPADGSWKMLRGEAWYDGDGYYFRAACRALEYPWQSVTTFGFRVSSSSG